MKYELGIPMPEGYSRGRQSGGTDWEDMPIGASLFFADEGRKKCTAASNWGSRQSPKRKFAMRSVDGGHRIWRTE